VLLFPRSNFREHLRWLLGCLGVTAAALVWFLAAGAGSSAWPSGSSLPGLTFGVAGGLICIFELLLWPRKKLRAWRLGRVVWWMRAHIWLGLLAVPLLVLHSGLRWGGVLSTVLMVLFLAVVVSGVWGLAVQQFLPTLMLERVPAETIYSQIDHVIAQLTEEAERLVEATCGPEGDGGGRAAGGAADDGPTGERHLVVGAVRSAGRVQGKVLETLAPAAPVPHAEALRLFVRTSVRPYLLGGARTGSDLRLRARAEALFRDLRTRLAPAAHGAVGALEGLCEQRRQLDQQVRIHVWMHNWLCVHLPLSVALLALMFIHAWAAVRYW
jgi:hypothetical protein